jgi:Flp pilus assembly CpaF family ATPase
VHRLAARRAGASHHRNHRRLPRQGSHAQKPILEGEFPLDGSRFAGQLPPVVPAPTFAIRKKAVAIFTLAQYVERGIMTAGQRESMIEASARTGTSW